MGLEATVTLTDWEDEDQMPPTEEILARLSQALATMINDDRSQAGSPARARLIARMDALALAAEAIRRAAQTEGGAER